MRVCLGISRMHLPFSLVSSFQDISTSSTREFKFQDSLVILAWLHSVLIKRFTALYLQKDLRQFSQGAAKRNWGDSQPYSRLNETQFSFVRLDVP